MNLAIVAFPDCSVPASLLAAELGCACHELEVHRFPDGESRVRVPAVANTVLLYRSLDRPNAKIVELLLAASALRENGTARVVLIAPYLGYMRQDVAFRPGEAVSQRVIGKLLAGYFDALVTIDPHLHRITRLGEAVPKIPAISLSAAPVLSSAIGPDSSFVLVGPDSESRPWVEAVAAPLGLKVLIGEKQRYGDRNVNVKIDGVQQAEGRVAILVDDVISSGHTMIAASRLLLEAGAIRVEAMATHCLADPNDLEAMRSAGIVRVTAAQTTSSPVARLPVANLLASGLQAAGLTNA